MTWHVLANLLKIMYRVGKKKLCQGDGEVLLTILIDKDLCFQIFIDQHSVNQRHGIALNFHYIWLDYLRFHTRAAKSSKDTIL